ncbi:MAG: LysM peptidoglycan-binding domain-containing protein [Spirochaetales bacterium]|nr:LysM peptidoglycan-binding domain-containing protein [Spirochaetales bacterium]
MDKKYLLILIIFSFIFFMLFTAYTETPKEQGFWHTIQWGETLIGIARKYNVSPTLLAKANNINNWNYIYTGFKLWIPAGELIEVYVYTVRWGDTLLAIAQKFHVDMWEIAAINQIYNMNYIYTGQTLYIPKK